VSAQHVIGPVAAAGTVRGESGRDLGEDVRVEHGDVERLVSAGVAGAVLPELDLDDRVSPGVPVAQPQVGQQLLAQAAHHDVAVDEGPQFSDLVEFENEAIL